MLITGVFKTLSGESTCLLARVSATKVAHFRIAGKYIEGSCRRRCCHYAIHEQSDQSVETITYSLYIAEDKQGPFHSDLSSVREGD